MKGNASATTQPVAGLIVSLEHITIPHDLATGTRLKRTRPGSNKKRKKYDYGIVVHIKPGATMGITVLWMRDTEALDPELNETADDFSKLASFKHNYLDAAKKSAVPQKASYDLLKNYWYAHTATSTRWPLQLLLRGLHCGGWRAPSYEWGLYACTRVDFRIVVAAAAHFRSPHAMDSEPQCDGHPLPGAALCRLTRRGDYLRPGPARVCRGSSGT